ncbi:MAG: hypothetical protein CVV34_03200 [Methanomicrobiales archaeon HGW-Methanomicrobiales-5]|nr:MAG: hypothetical protein CVV34_03200 [Methanomicrobiales archaeon HGW-Methanomicrobiales-5]
MDVVIGSRLVFALFYERIILFSVSLRKKGKKGGCIVEAIFHATVRQTDSETALNILSNFY